MRNNRVWTMVFAVLGVVVTLGLVAPSVRADVDKGWCDHYYDTVWRDSCNRQSDSVQARKCWEMAAHWLADCRAGKILKKMDRPLGITTEGQIEWLTGSTRS